MMLSKRILLLILITSFPTLLFCQIKITSPQNRAVYQRNQEGFSQITVSGTYATQIDKIEARLIPVEAGQGEAVDWTVIKLLPLNGNFNAVMRVKQGWYSLELRGSLNGANIGGTSRVDRVGVGEVFVIAGQSNAQGMPHIAGIGATNDRVNCFGSATDTNFGGDFYINLSPFSKLEAGSRIAPRGMNGWCWGRLGDLLVSKLNVPVMFFNAAFEGTSSSTWATTANGNIAPNPYTGDTYKNKLPYQDLSDAFHYFVAQLGVRSVLWCQGESDNFFINQKLVVDSEKYRSNLQTVINKSRTDSGKDITWVVSLTSGGSSTPCNFCSTPIVTDANVIKGQQAVINQANNNVFQGPNTDLIQVTGRQDGVHFNGVGLEQLASAWNNALDNNFFSNSKPQLPNTISDLTFSCGNNQVNVSLPDGFSNYQWSNNGSNFANGVFSTQRNATLAVGTDKTYYARYRDKVGNIIQVPYISFVGSAIPSSSITAGGDVSFCDGNSVALNANDASIYEWSNGSTSKSITVTNSGSFAVRTVNQFGCQSGFSAPVITTNKPLPAKPVITAGGPTTFCADTDVTLSSSSLQANGYAWSTGSNSQNIKVNTSGTYTVQTINSQGCFSPASDGVKILVNPLPPKPNIAASGPLTFCADTDVTLTSSSLQANSYLWNTGSNTPNIKTNTSGSYTVKTISTVGCFSPVSDAVQVLAKLLPPKPMITANSPTTFCADTNVVLTSSNLQAVSYLWSTGSSSQNIKINVSGNYTIRTINNQGCYSPSSDGMRIVVNPLPPTPSILPNGPTTFCADTNVVLTSTSQNAVKYLWNTGATSNAIKINMQGNYIVRTIDNNNCYSINSPTMRITVNQLPITPTIVTSKDSVFCDGDNTILQMSLASGNKPTWVAAQNGTVTSYGIQNLTVTKSGAFRAFQTDINNCKSVISPNVYVSVKPNPVVVDSIVRLSPYTVAVNAVKADQYVWQVNGVVNNTISGSPIRFTEEANLSVIAKNVYKTLFYGDKFCYSPVSKEYVFRYYDDRGVSIYPNPSNGVLKIEARNDWNNTTYEVYDLLGRMVRRGTIASLDTSRTLDLTMLPEGEYMLRLNTESLLIAKRIIINR
ncbi:T9SS type A sorting domain-containing protein [Arcicella sp. DC2W]|uniref:T9SS type A sorting domain-containing protein n=1 Tax=Arcicella gelida TaxID=2984195 RepID=A0ABU5S1K3_9BACT|nr:T9SS type A sorting domain-containing protein [Arcicella sp. DC2W]MEA5402344.1 T9SS type A sorting domain-containing protein [Arcicella sp. DC2W]